MATIRLKRNESFYIREGWFEKAINTIGETEKNIFYKNDGIKYLGIGSNMVKGLKYWLKAADVIDPNTNLLSDFGNILFDYDKYLDELFSWFMIHYKLTKNEDECPIAYEIFNSDIKQFTKTSVLEYLTNKLLSKDDNVNPKYIDADLNIFLRSYYNDNTKINPEDNLVCPLSRLKLLDKEKDAYKRIRPSYNSLSYLVVFYALEDLYEVESFDIDESMEAKNSPMKIFNLDKYLYLQYLDDMRKNGLITINKTAGLNTVYFERRLELEDIFNEYFGGRKNV